MGIVKWHIALPHLALVREVHQEREDVEKWFLIRDRVVRFGLEEFVLITGLSPEGSFDLNDFKQKMSFKKKMFPELTIKVLQEQVRARFLAGDFDDDVDAMKMAVVYLLSHYLYGYENSKRVDNELFGFVDGDFFELRNIAFGKLLWDRTFHYMNLAFKDGDNIYYKIEKAKEEKDKFYSFKFQGFPFAFLIWLFEILPSLSPNYCKRIANTYPRMLNWESSYKKKTGGYSELVSEVFNNLEPTVKDFYPVGRELKKAALQNFSNLEKALDEFNIKFDEVIELLKSKKRSYVPKDCEEKAKNSCSANIDVVSKSNLPEYDDDEGGYNCHSFGKIRLYVHSGLGDGREEGSVFSYETITVDQSIFYLVDRITPAYSSPLSAKNEKWDSVSIPESVSPAVEDETERQAKPGVHCRSPFVNEFGSSEPKIQNKKNKEASSELSFDPKELFPFVKDDCGGYVKWIEDARLMKKKNNEKTAGDINPPFDFSIAQINDKSWFVILQTCGKELTDLHLNVALYYLRKSILYDASVNKRVTTTCSYFDATLKGVYAEFIKAKRDPSVIRYDNMVTDYILGQYNFCFQPWIGVDDVVGSCHVGVQRHWIFLHFSILRRKIFIFNFMKNTKKNQKKILPDLLANDISLESGPYAVPKNTPIEYEFVDKLPTQSNSDCGVFVIKYADMFIRGKINEIPPDMDEMITHYRDDLAVTLYNYGQKKIYEGYSTEDKPKGKKSKKKNSPQHSRKLTILVSRIQLLHDHIGFHLAGTGYIHMFCPTVATAFSMLLYRSEMIVMPASQKPVPQLSSFALVLVGLKIDFPLCGCFVSIEFDQKQLKKLPEEDRSCRRRSEVDDQCVEELSAAGEEDQRRRSLLVLETRSLLSSDRDWCDSERDDRRQNRRGWGERDIESWLVWDFPF
ncbi:hypothetical protein G4B88_020964 [Cannabis sativa]|uniref:Ubiquitin-like protease family profile domain-containing protein n=1 Tax=Cannabis sativa TaxID=3483 RepID=A0A7J6EJS7_CANSA|nr:hypothetical protein G4B88_020964 [Cannabis sativa]